MPFFYDPNLDEENQNQSSVNISGASPTFQSNGSQQQQGQNDQNLNTGSGFVNLDKYLQANNAQEFGQKLQGKVGDQVQGAQAQMDSAGNELSDQIQNSNKLPSQQDIDQAIADPSHADKNAFQGWENETYTGPKDLSDNEDVWNRYWSGVNQAQTNTKLLGTEPGRFTLLDQYFGRPSYNFGEKSLDNLLYQESGQGNQAQALQDQATQLKATGDQKVKDLQGAASQRAGEVEQNRAQVLKSIGINPDKTVITGQDAGAIGKEWQSAQDAMNKTNADRQQAQNDFKLHLATGEFTPEELQTLGLTAGQHLYNRDLGDYFTAGQDLNQNQSLSPEQRAKIQALSQLAGINDTFASGPADLTAASPAYSFDSHRLIGDASTDQNAYETALKDTPVSMHVAVLNPKSPMATIRLEDLEKHVADVKNKFLDGDEDEIGAREFLDQAIPLIQKTHEEIERKYNPNRTLVNNSQRLGSSAIRPGAKPILPSDYKGPAIYAR